MNGESLKRLARFDLGFLINLTQSKTHSLRLPLHHPVVDVVVSGEFGALGGAG